MKDEYEQVESDAIDEMRMVVNKHRTLGRFNQAMVFYFTGLTLIQLLDCWSCDYQWISILEACLSASFLGFMVKVTIKHSGRFKTFVRFYADCLSLKRAVKEQQFNQALHHLEQAEAGYKQVCGELPYKPGQPEDSYEA